MIDNNASLSFPSAQSDSFEFADKSLNCAQSMHVNFECYVIVSLQINASY